MNAPPKIVFLDVEGGRGGSSRSLFYLLKAIAPTRWRAVVLMRLESPFRAQYEALGIETELVPELPSFRPAERHNWYTGLRFALRWMRNSSALEKRLRVHAPDLLYVNHESLALPTSRLARRLGIPWMAHIRTTLFPSAWSRWLNRLIARQAAGIIFITDRNLDHFRMLAAGCFVETKATVVHNISPPVPDTLEPHPALAGDDGSFKVLSLSNLTPQRGVDRVVDVAEALKRRGEQGFVFYLCGRASDTSGSTTAMIESMHRRIQDGGLSEMIRFPGHLSEPERALVAAGAVIRLSRMDNAWGRDIIEAMTAGVPVVTLGTYQGFVEHGRTGYIEPVFNPERIADFLVRLRSEPGLRAGMAETARAKARALFDPSVCAAGMEGAIVNVLRSMGKLP